MAGLTFELDDLLRAAALGLGATLVMDLWNLFLRRAFGIPSLDLRLLGRWVLHMPAGTFRHARIGAAAPKRFECALGWLAHYSIGIALAVGFVLAAPDGWLARPTLLPALAWGLVTVVFPFFLMQPALGLGVASVRAPRPAQARVKSLASHATFGMGLYLAGWAVVWGTRIVG
jgi:hypothetical protein